MPATPADIAAASRDVVVATWSDAAIAGRYPSARDGSVQPEDGFFDAIADAQTIINARGMLIGSERRRFETPADGAIWPSDPPEVPQVRLVDSEQGAAVNALAGRFELDLEAETSTFELYG